MSPLVAAVQLAADILDAQDDLVVAIEAHDRLFRPSFKAAPGLMLAVDCDPRRGYVLVCLIDVNESGEVTNVHGEARLDSDECVDVAGRIVTNGDEWALEMWSRVLEVVAERWTAVAS